MEPELSIWLSSLVVAIYVALGGLRICGSEYHALVDRRIDG
jgi:hypothetical protein